MEYRIIYLISSSIEILGIATSDRKNENENNLMKQDYQIARILKSWITRNFIIEVISKVIQLALVSNNLRLIVDQLNKIQKRLM